MGTYIRLNTTLIRSVFGLLSIVIFCFARTGQGRSFRLTAESGVIEGNRLQAGPLARLVFRYSSGQKDENHTLGFKTSFAPELLLGASALFSWRWNGRLDYSMKIKEWPLSALLHAGALNLSPGRDQEYAYTVMEGRLQTRVILNRRLMFLPGGGIKKQIFSAQRDEGVMSVPLETVFLYRLGRENSVSFGAAWEKYFIDESRDSGLRYSPVMRFDHKGGLIFSLAYRYYIYEGSPYRGREHRIRFNMAMMLGRDASLLLNGSLILLPSKQEIRSEQVNVSGLGERSSIYLKTVYDLSKHSDLFIKYIYERDRYKNDYKSFSWQVLVGFDYLYGTK